MGVDGIVFVSDRDGNNEIYVLDMTQGLEIRLTYNEANDRDPVWSPDGTKIAFTSDRLGGNDIFVMDRNGANPTRFSQETADERFPDWHPDGALIAFYRGAGICIYNAQNEGNCAPLGGGQNNHPSWAPDGTKVAIQRDQDIYYFYYNPYEYPPTELTYNTAWEGMPDWSPDGESIVYVSFVGSGNAEIFVMDAADGGNQTNLTNNAYSDRYPAWSPDGTQVVFTSNRDGDNEIFIMDANGENQVQLTDNEYEDVDPHFFPVLFE